MKKNIGLYLFIILLTVLFHAGTTVTNENISKSRYAKDHFIVKMKKETSLIAAAGFLSSISDVSRIETISQKLNIEPKKIKRLFPTDFKHNTELARKYELDKYYLVFADTIKEVPDLCREFEKDPNIDFAEPDFIGESAGEKSAETIKPNDTFFNRQWGLYNDGSVRTTTGKQGKSGADMNVLAGWDIESGSSDIVIAILDSGTKLDHPDLAGKFWVNKDEVLNGRDDDGNGFVDDINGYNFAYDDADVRDDGGHGTNICGTVGANTNNSLGYAGINQNATLMICKNLDDENLGEYSWWSTSLYFAANNGARIINMSEGGYDYSKTLNKAIDYAYDAGCLIVASMMNKNNDDNYYPASFKNVLAVGATDTDDGRCRQFTWGGGSNWGKHIAVIAPGNRIYGLDYKDNSNYDVYWSGTSQATAYVTGIASLLLSQDTKRTNKDLKEIIISTAADQVGDPREDTPGWDEYYGYGRVDLYAALMFSKSPVEKRLIKDKNNGANNNNDNDKQNYDTKERNAKAVERNSSTEDNRDDKRARKVEH